MQKVPAAMLGELLHSTVVFSVQRGCGGCVMFDSSAKAEEEMKQTPLHSQREFCMLEISLSFPLDFGAVLVLP